MRKITSLTSLLSFVVIVITSVILYVAPHGRVAYWADWRLFGLTKDEWSDIHILVGLLFLLALFYHVYLNWKPIMAALKNAAKKITVFTREFNIALVLTVVFTLAAYFHVPPLSLVLDAAEAIKTDSEQVYGNPPYGHAELSTIKTFCMKMSLDPDKSLDLLGAAGIVGAVPDITLKDLAAANETSPKDLHQIMSFAAKPKPADQTGDAGEDLPTGLGMLTVAQTCDKYGIDQDKAIKALAAMGISAQPDSKMKKLAEDAGLSPLDLYLAIK